MTDPVITQDLGIVSKQLEPIVNVRQLQNIIDTIGQNLENGSVDNPMISFEGDRTTGFYYDANEGKLVAVSHGVEIFSFNQNGFSLASPIVQTYGQIVVTGTSVSDANVLSYGINELLAGTGDAVILDNTLNNGSVIYVRNISGQTISIYPTSGASFYGLSANQSIDILPGQFIAIRCIINTTRNTITYYGNVFAGVDANGDAVFQNLAVQTQATFTGLITVDDGNIVIKKGNLQSEAGYIGVSSVGNLSLNATSGTTAQYQFNIITDTPTNGIIDLPDMSNEINGATIIIKNTTGNNVLVYPPSGESIADLGTGNPLNLASKSGGMFTYVSGYWAHSILLSTKPDGNVIMPGAAAYSTFSQQEPTITYGSNQSNATGNVPITGQIIFLDNQYTDVNVNEDSGNIVDGEGAGEANVVYSLNTFMLDDSIPQGTFLFLICNYFYQNDAGNNSSVTLQTSGESNFVTNYGLTLPNNAPVSQEVTLPGNFNYLLVKTANQWGNPIWVICPIGQFRQNLPTLGNIQQDQETLDVTSLLASGSIEAQNINAQQTLTGQYLNLSRATLQVDIGNTQSSAAIVTDMEGFFVDLINVTSGSNGVTIETNQQSGNSINTFIIRNTTGQSVLIFPSQNGYINELSQNASYTMGAYETILVSGYVDTNGNLHLQLVLLGLSENVQGTSKYMSALPNGTGVSVSGNLDVTGGNILCPNVTTSQNAIVEGYVVKSYEYGIEASGSGQSDATVLTSIVNVVTQAGGSYCVKPTAGLTAGTCLEIYNRSGQTIKIYPANGEQIETFNQNDFCLLANNSAVKMTVIEQNSRRMWITAVIGSPISQTGDS